MVLPGDAPRGLAVTPDGKTVYAAVFHSGNQTASITSQLTCPQLTTPGVGRADVWVFDPAAPRIARAGHAREIRAGALLAAVGGGDERGMRRPRVRADAPARSRT